MIALWAAAIGGLLGCAIFVFLWSLERGRRQRRERAIQDLRSQIDDSNRALESQARQWRALIEGLEIPIFICKENGTVEMANEAAKQFFQFVSPDGRSLVALTFSADLSHLLQRCTHRLAQVNGHIQLNYPAEGRLYASVWPFPPFQGEKSAYAVMLIDQTEQRRLEQVRRDFVANVSHELRSPLAAVRALAETVQDEPDMPVNDRGRFLSLIVDETERLTRIADDVLTLSQAELQPPRKEPMDLTEIARAIIERKRREAEQDRIEIIDELPPRLPVSANPDQMTQVVINLIENAIKYNKTGGSVIVRGGEQDGQTWLEVEDDGIGILSADLPRIFERFYRADKARSRDSGGTGLGLSIVKHIIEAHGGSATVESELHKGSRFRISIPTSA